MKETTMPARINRTNVQKIAAVQSLIVAMMAIIVGQWDKSLALAIIYGSAIFIIPNTYFAWKSFRYIGAAQSKLVIQSFYTGQTTKFVLTVIMFVFLFALVKPVSVAVVFLSYGINALFHVAATAAVLNKSLKIK